MGPRARARLHRGGRRPRVRGVRAEELQSPRPEVRRRAGVRGREDVVRVSVGQRLRVSKFGKIRKILQIFGGLVLGCIKTKFCKKICV